MGKYLAIDIGASSGRGIVGYIKEGKIQLHEVYRFKNGPIKEDGHLYWDIDSLFLNVLEAIKKAKKEFDDITSLSIDTWAVDYVLLKDGRRASSCFCYRDDRTKKIIDEVHNKISFDKLYEKTGIQFQQFNTIYQLYEDKVSGRLDDVDEYMMLPEYLIYKLTGKRCSEYTNATTTGLLNATTHSFDQEIIEKLDLPKKLFDKKISQPGSFIGTLSKDVQRYVGGNIDVVLDATHDTASAILAIPSNKEESIYLSSGTWSLLGVEQKEAHRDQLSMKNNFSNEGDLNNTFRYQKNIMGLWMIQSLRNEMGIDFKQGQQLALNNKIEDIIDVNDDSFLAPKSMKEAIRDKIGDKRDGEILYCAYNSLAHCYDKAIKDIEKVLDKSFDTLYIVGGGSQDVLLNEMTSEICNIDIVAGPKEGTALGNILMQMIASKEIQDIKEGRELIKRDEDIKTYERRKI